MPSIWWRPVRPQCRDKFAYKMVILGDQIHCQKENQDETEWSMSGLGAATGNQYVLRVEAEGYNPTRATRYICGLLLSR
jgi:hypothetical protein